MLGAIRGTPAARAGIRYGDILMSVNGMRTRSAQDYIEAKALRDGGMDVVIFRTGSEETISLTYTAGAPPDPAAILAELAALRLVSETGEGAEGGGGPGTLSS